jgi:hypothetical protein
VAGIQRQRLGAPAGRAGQIRELLPDANPYQAWANIEFLGTDSSVNDVDLLALTAGGCTCRS